MYREQVIQLEDELARIREEGDVTREIFRVSFPFLFCNKKPVMVTCCIVVFAAFLGLFLLCYR